MNVDIETYCAAIMRPYHSALGGLFVARCPKCDAVCAYWDDDDLDDDGNLICWEPEEADDE